MFIFCNKRPSEENKRTQTMYRWICKILAKSSKISSVECVLTSARTRIQCLILGDLRAEHLHYMTCFQSQMDLYNSCCYTIFPSVILELFVRWQVVVGPVTYPWLLIPLWGICWLLVGIPCAQWTTILNFWVKVLTDTGLSTLSFFSSGMLIPLAIFYSL